MFSFLNSMMENIQLSPVFVTFCEGVFAWLIYGLQFLEGPGVAEVTRWPILQPHFLAFWHHNYI